MSTRGTAALLGLAHLLSRYAGRLTVELVPLNGEDYYGATGEKRFERDNEGHWDDVVLGMNVDAAGWRGHATEVSLFGLDDTTDRVVRSSVSSRPGFAVGEPWYQSDHGLFRLHGRPAVAVISEGYAELAANVTHTAADGLELADPGIAADVSTFFADVIAGLEEVAGAAEVMPMRRVRPRATSEVRTGRAPRTRSSVPDGPSPRSAP